MERFIISIDGTPPVEVANKFWVEISRYNVNFMVLEHNCYIYGDADDKTIDILHNKSKSFGFPVVIERG